MHSTHGRLSCIIMLEVYTYTVGGRSFCEVGSYPCMHALSYVATYIYICS